MLNAFKKKIILKAAKKQTNKAREAEGSKAEQLYKSAYEGYAEVVKNDIVLAEALYNWGFALLHHAKFKGNAEAIELYKDAINKFNFCLLIEPNHLGSAIDGGVAYMELAQIKQVDINNELYVFAEKAFENAERIQKGSASFNIACIYGIKENEGECLKYLELSKEFGSLPDAIEINNDKDLRKIQNKQWFVEFMECLSVEPEPEIKDINKIEYDEEGKVIRKVEKDLRRFPETERNGKVYDVEGNVIRSISTKDVPVIKEKIEEQELEESIEIKSKDIKSPGVKSVAMKAGYIASKKQDDVVRKSLN